MSNTKNAYPFPAFKKNVGLLSKISFSKQIDVFDNYSVLGRMEFLGTLPDTNPLTPIQRQFLRCFQQVTTGG